MRCSRATVGPEASAPLLAYGKRGTAPGSVGIRVESNNLQAHIPLKHEAHTKEQQNLEAAMTGHLFVIFDTSIGRCGIAWGPRGSRRNNCRWVTRKRPAGGFANAMATSQRRWRRRGAERDRWHRRTAFGQAERSCRYRARSRRRSRFHRGVYDIARTIPPGQTMTYGDIANGLAASTVARRRPGAGTQSLSDRGAVSSRAGRRRQARRILRQWRRRHQAENAGYRGRGGQSHPQLVRLRCRGPWGGGVRGYVYVDSP